MAKERDQIMQHQTHSLTLIAVVRQAVEQWRKENAWSRETVADQIVQAHYAYSLDMLTGITFDPQTRDTFERMRVNADRIFRWLDDSTKDRNLLPANFIWSVMAALPEDRRVHLADALLAPVGLASRFADADDESDDELHAHVVQHFQAIVEHSSESNVAFSKMLDGVDPGEPEEAHKKLSRAAAATQRALGFVKRLMLKRKGKK